MNSKSNKNVKFELLLVFSLQFTNTLVLIHNDTINYRQTTRTLLLQGAAWCVQEAVPEIEPNSWTAVKFMPGVPTCGDKNSRIMGARLAELLLKKFGGLARHVHAPVTPRARLHKGIKIWSVPSTLSLSP